MSMAKGHTPWEDEEKFNEEHPDVGTSAINTAVCLCQRTDEQVAKFLKDPTVPNVYDIWKIYAHTLECGWCTRWIQDRQERLDRIANPPVEDPASVKKAIEFIKNTALGS